MARSVADKFSKRKGMLFLLCISMAILGGSQKNWAALTKEAYAI